MAVINNSLKPSLIGAGIKTLQYDNTTLAEHLDEILGYTNPLNGGTLLFIGFKLESSLQGLVTSIITDTSTGQITSSNTSIPVLPADNFTLFRPASIYPDNGTTQQIKFITAEVNTIGIESLILSKAGGVQLAILSGAGYGLESGTDSTIVQLHICPGISILNARLTKLVIEYQTSN